MSRPARMSKVRIVGSKKRIEQTIECLYSLKKIDFRKPENGISSGQPLDKGDDISQTLVKIRSLKSSLPEPENPVSSKGFSSLQENLESLREKTSNSKEKISRLNEEIQELETKLEFVEQFSSTELEARDLNGTRTLDCIAGDFPEDIGLDPETDKYEIVEGKDTNLAYYVEDDVGQALKKNGETTKIPEINRQGQLSDIEEDLQEEIKQKHREKEEASRTLNNIAESWMKTIEQSENFLEEEIEKSEAPLSFGTTKSAFIAEGFVPEEDYTTFKQELQKSLSGNIHVEKIDNFDDEPPVKHENHGLVENFEPLNDLISVPRYNEVDPSILLMLTFPAMFGFMIGDAGYGITTAMVFYGATKIFPQQKKIFRSLMVASGFTVLFGLAFGDAFGYIIFGDHSALTRITGIELFSQIPILFHRAEHLKTVFEASVVIGLAHVNMGFLVGMYNEYMRHGPKEAILAKGSWILLQASAATGFLLSPLAGIAGGVTSVAMLFKAEGIEGLVEIPSLISNVLSYARIFGVSVAAVVLAKVVNTLAEPLLGGGIIATAAGIGLLAIGHTFNTFIKIMEGFLQGIRLHYVEFYSKFYEGGGTKYTPFGK
jgi:V/A-type H+-transporting ATPase subunit I